MEAAFKQSNALHIHTPLIEARARSQALGKQVMLKMDNLQPSGSFKMRGIGRFCQAAGAEGVRHFVSSSGGNAGYAAAYAGRMLHIPTTVFVPTTTPAALRGLIGAQGAEVRVAGEVWDQTHEEALRFAQETGARYVPPFDHPLLWQGHATLVDEMLADMGQPDTIVLSVGGGGLLCGVLEGLRQHALTGIPVVAVETEGTASLAASLQAGELVTLEKVSGVAKSLAAKTVARQAFEWAARYNVQSVVVSDAAAMEACVRFADEQRCLVEAACGASLSLAYQNHAALQGAQRIVIIVCGGIGIDLERLHAWRSELGL